MAEETYVVTTDQNTQNVIQCPWERDGYIFNGWNTEPDGSGDTPTGDTIALNQRSYDLYAQWIEDPVIKNVSRTLESGVPSGDINYQNKSYGYLYFTNSGTVPFWSTGLNLVFGKSSFLSQTLTGISVTASNGSSGVGGRSGIALKSITPSGNKLYTQVKLSPYICMYFNKDNVPKGSQCVNNSWKYTDRGTSEWSVNMNSSGTMPLTGYSYYSRGKYFRVKMTIQKKDGSTIPLSVNATANNSLDGWTQSSLTKQTLTFNFTTKLIAANLEKGARTTKIEFFESTSTAYTYPAAVNAVCLYYDTLNSVS